MAQLNEESSPPAQFPTITFYRGDDKDFPPIQLLGPDNPDGSEGPPLNVSEWGWNAQWRVSEDDTEYLQLYVDDSDSANGFLYVSAPASITAQMNSGGVWDLQGAKPDGKFVTKVKGKTKLLKDVSRNV